MNSTSFGFLCVPLEASFPGLTLCLLPEYERKLTWITQSSNKDGFFYTPNTVTWRCDPATGARLKRIPRSERPAQSFHLPVSHEISLTSPIRDSGSIESDDSFLVQTLAFLFGTRLQIARWRFDGRIPIERQDSMWMDEATAIHFLEHAYSWWRSLSDINRGRMVNILYSYTRALSMEWEWDAFPWQYMIFDAIWRLHRDIECKKDAGIKHVDRIAHICLAFGTPCPKDSVDELVKARNDLFHEGLWMSHPVGFSPAGDGGIQLPKNLARLNARLICAITGYKNAFVQSGWDFMGWQQFDRMP